MEYSIRIITRCCKWQFEGRGVLLLYLGDELLLAVQLISKFADLFLVGLSVRLDLPLHSLLEEENMRHFIWAPDCIKAIKKKKTKQSNITLTSLADWISFSFSMALTFSETGFKRKTQCVSLQAYAVLIEPDPFNLCNSSCAILLGTLIYDWVAGSGLCRRIFSKTAQGLGLSWQQLISIPLH